MQIDLTSLLKDTLDRLKSYESTETLSSIMEDKTLYGYLNLARELLSIFMAQADYDDVIKFEQEQGLIDEIYYENLFYVPAITTSPNANKAKVTKNRAAAYKLLYKYVHTLKPKELASFLDNYLWKMIKD